MWLEVPLFQAKLGMILGVEQKSTDFFSDIMIVSDNCFLILKKRFIFVRFVNCAFSNQEKWFSFRDFNNGKN